MELGELYVYFLAMSNFIGIFSSRKTKNDPEKSKKSVKLAIFPIFLHFQSPIFWFGMNNIPISYTLPKSTHKVLPIPSESFQKFWRRKRSCQIKNPENLSVLGQIGRVTRLEFPIFTTNTIFRNLKSMRVQ